MKKNTYPGKFIVIEGLDGSGQTTQAELFKNFFIKQGFKVVLTKEPTLDSEAGKRIREILDNKIKAEAGVLQELFTQDRRDHLQNKILPALKEGKIVISDRYFFSTFAYGAADGLDLERLIGMNNDFLLPDLTFILKVSPEVCVERIEKRGKGIKLFEKKEKLEKVWETYRILPGRFENVYMVEGERTKEEVFSQIKDIVLSQLTSNISKKNKEV
ncbi:MAG: dTMP kinase [Candidatus Pacebacteria bacterium]|nr:dTMP kinase [Candidatus Paceibacterota bacterium]